MARFPVTAQNGSKIFAIVNMLAISISTLYVIGRIIYLRVGIGKIAQLERNDEGRNIDDNFSLIFAIMFAGLGYFLIWELVFILILCLQNLLFAALLLYGIFKRKPDYMKVYFFNGVGSLILALALYIGVCADLGFELMDHRSTAAIISTCILYPPVLYMIRYSYKQIEMQNEQYDHKPIADNIQL